MEAWMDLKNKSGKTEAECMVLMACKMIHKSRVVSSTSEEAVYTVCASKAGVSIEGRDKDEPVKATNPTSFEDGVVTIFQQMIEDGKHLTKTGMPELPELNEKLVEADFATLSAAERNELFKELSNAYSGR